MASHRCEGASNTAEPLVYEAKVLEGLMLAEGLGLGLENVQKDPINL